MSALIYYSNHCQNSKKLILMMSKNLDRRLLSSIHFISVDKRTTVNGHMYAILDNGQQFHIPQSIQSVPAMVLINQGNHILFGNQIYQYLGMDLRINVPQTRQQVEMNDDPEPFSFEGISGSCAAITSDKYSFVDIPAKEMLAEGNGGMAQLHSYVTLEDYTNGNMRIHAPEDDGKPLKLGDVSIDILQKQRNSEVTIKGGPSFSEMPMPSYR